MSKADEVTVQAMRDKGPDTENRKLRADLIRRLLVSLHDLTKGGHVQKVGHGPGVRWQLLGGDMPEEHPALRLAGVDHVGWLVRLKGERIAVIRAAAINI